MSQIHVTNHGGSSLPLYVGDVTLHCDGNFTSLAAGNLEFAGAGNPELQVDGNYTINSGSTFTPGVGEVEFTGGAAQLLDAGSFTHYDVTINNSSGGVSLTSSDLTLSNGLAFSNGHLVLGIQDCIIENTANVTGAAYNIGFVVAASFGVLTIQDIGGAGAKTGTVTFPIGYSTVPTAYSPISFENDPGTAGDFSVRLDDDVLEGGTSGSTITDYVVDRTWHVTTTSGSPSVIISAQWHNSQELGSFRRYKCYLSYWNVGTDWIASEAEGVSTNDGNDFHTKLTAARQTTVSKPWAVASNNLLPVELLTFGAEAQDDEVLLDWTTASELNNDYFEVERSSDGYYFETIGEVTGAGNSTQMIDYNFLDENPLPGKSYYRLRQVDFDGQYEHSEIKVVEFEGNFVESKIYPNPAKEILQLEFEAELSGIYQVLVINQAGQQVESFSVIGHSNQKNQMYINLERLTSGQYQVMLISPDEQTKNHTFIKY